MNLIRTILMLAAMPLLFTVPFHAIAADGGESVVVLYNSKMPESKEVADYYAKRRQVPASQVFGWEMPTTESISRKDFTNTIQDPLLKRLEENKLFVFRDGTNRLGTNPNGPNRYLAEAKIKYLTICYGVPVKIDNDTNLVENVPQDMQQELRVNHAAVDSELACLPLLRGKFVITGPIGNPVFANTNRANFHPTNGVLLVARLDGPSATLAKGLVDKALSAETNGLWGRAYFDARGITNAGLAIGDEMMKEAAMASLRHGFDTVYQDSSNTFAAGFPLSHIAFYAGWYDQAVSGPFAHNTAEFMPGAVAYHLHSFSARQIRYTNAWWVGPLVAKGATATIGYTEEPYLGLTIDIPILFSRLVLLGFTYGEAAYAAQRTTSWQTTVIGDPLYRPGSKGADVLHKELEQRKDPMFDWSFLRVLNQGMAAGAPMEEAIAFLESQPVTKQSPIVKEKLGDMYWVQKKFSDAMDTYADALRLNPSKVQRLRLLMSLASKRTTYGPDKAAIEWYEKLLSEYPDYPERRSIYERLLPLAQKTNNKELIQRCEAELQKK